MMGTRIARLVASLAAAVLLTAACDRTADAPGTGGTTPSVPRNGADASPTERAAEDVSPSSPLAGDAKSPIEVWSGPDEAVSSWRSKQCNRDVLSFGSQQYEQGATVYVVPDGVTDLGYRRGSDRLWGDRASPRTLYVTRDEGESFLEWTATTEECSP